MPGWIDVPLIGITNREVKWSFTGGPFGSNLKASDYTDSGIRIIQLQNIGDGIFHDEYHVYTSVDKADELRSSNIYPGEIIMSKMGDPVGRACFVPVERARYLMCSDGIRVVVNESEHDKYFIYSQINSQSFRKIVESNATGSTRKRIGLEELKKLSLAIPTKEEQQKIAHCLSSLDELIAAQARKVEALKKHKKGLMQQLFPREGETVPRLRFEEFRGSGEWEVKYLFNVCDMGAGKFVAAAEIFEIYGAGCYPCYGGNGLRGYTQTFTHSGTFPIVGRQGALCGNVKLVQGHFHATEHAVVATPNSNVDVYWLYHQLDKMNLNRYATGQAQPGLSVDTIGKLQIRVPYAIAEQRKVGETLNAIDVAIFECSQKIELFHRFKSGLMQVLFPSAPMAKE